MLGLILDGMSQHSPIIKHQLSCVPVRLAEVRGQFRSVLGSDPYPTVRARLLTEVRAQYQHIQAANNYRFQEVSYGAV